ncbi:MAG: PQQ-binding-like beta-propeller repeat protein, partial [Verrucomicrobiota bacterium]
MAVGESFIHNGLVFKGDSGAVGLKITPGRIAATEDGFVCAAKSKIVPYRWSDLEGKRPIGVTPGYTNFAHIGAADSLVVADKTLALGFKDRVETVDLVSGESRWSAEVEGTVYALAVSDQGLYVGTDRGTIYCFNNSGDGEMFTTPVNIRQPFGPNEEFKERAEEVLALSGIQKGYALDLGCGTGALAFELARQSELQVIGVEENKT